MPAVMFLRRLLGDSLSLYWDLVKIMVPVMVAVKVAVGFGLIEAATAVFAPLMAVVGLPQEMGLVWATAALVNIYGGAAALIGVLPGTPLSVAQATVLLSMILAAHSLPVEQRVCQKTGAGLVFTTLLRLGAALLYGAILNGIYSALDVLQQPVVIAWLPSSPPDAGWAEWALDSLITLATIFAIIVALLALLRLLDASGVTAFLTRVLAPVLRVMGIGPQATPLAMVGVLLGLSYGGGLIIREARAGTLPPRDVFLAVCFMAICHSMIEDTLFMIALGGHWSGIVVGRLVFSLVVMAVLARIVHALPDAALERWLYRSPAPQPAE
ncbi:nucleoside recognition domain-containing protein [Novispirillum sp. DQ9]|uniref:nucleoside recognition domain-containing protein n=1 Tax=Novispirillum sp. DQ9 TaxID=3398612 RepID=UPI003C7BA596